MNTERITEGIERVQAELTEADRHLKACDQTARTTWRVYLVGLAGFLVAINLVLVLLPLGVSLIVLSVAAAVYGRIANRRALRRVSEIESQIIALKDELSRLQSLLDMM